MPVIVGNGIAILLVAGLVFLSLREILKGHKNGGCAGCSGMCAGCSKSCAHQHNMKEEVHCNKCELKSQQ